MSKVSTFVMFQGNAHAQQAIDLYSELFAGFKVQQVQHYEDSQDGPLRIRQAFIDFERQRLIFTDSPISHDFSFTPAISLFVNLANEAELERVFTRLAEGGKVLMPIDDYGFSARFGWLNDRFGLSWQLNVPAGDVAG
jgi:predicted 3-demethylubiquinone-9 3-methyltransferase (glyoxalase superfamily)